MNGILVMHLAADERRQQRAEPAMATAVLPCHERLFTSRATDHSGTRNPMDTQDQSQEANTDAVLSSITGRDLQGSAPPAFYH